MADIIPTNLPSPASNVNATYDWRDLAESTGYVTYYGFDNEEDTFSLTQNSSTYAKTADKNVGGADAATDEDFDITFANVHDIEGDLFVGITYYVDSRNNNAINANVAIKIVHYDGSTETVIGTQQTSDTISLAATGKIARRTTMKFNISRKRFNSGDTLRVNVVLTPGGSSASSTNCGYYFDPVNRDINGIILDIGNTITAPSQLVISVPERINL